MTVTEVRLPRSLGLSLNPGVKLFLSFRRTVSGGTQSLRTSATGAPEPTGPGGTAAKWPRQRLRGPCQVAGDVTLPLLTSFSMSRL